MTAELLVFHVKHLKHLTLDYVPFCAFDKRNATVSASAEMRTHETARKEHKFDVLFAVDGVCTCRKLNGGSVELVAGRVQVVCSMQVRASCVSE